MIHQSIEAFVEAICKKSIIALDISKNKIGIAGSDDGLLLAFPIITIQRVNFEQDTKQIIKVYKEQASGGIVVGNPLDLLGNCNPRTQGILDFVKLFLTRFDAPIFFEDERFSTKVIENTNKKYHKKHDPLIDAKAAAWFLQTFIDKKNNLL